MHVEVQNKLIKEILFVTDQIRILSPARYAVLAETPLFLSAETEIKRIELQQYLESIATQLDLLKRIM